MLRSIRSHALRAIRRAVPLAAVAALIVPAAALADPAQPYFPTQSDSQFTTLGIWAHLAEGSAGAAIYAYAGQDNPAADAGSSEIATFAPGVEVAVECQAQGETWTNAQRDSSNVWDLVAMDPSTGYDSAFVNDLDLDAGYSGFAPYLPRCDSSLNYPPARELPRSEQMGRVTGDWIHCSVYLE
jgi:hypothetical protein